MSSGVTANRAETEFCVVMCTADSQEEANRLAHQAVEHRLAACVQIMPVGSVYRWQDEVLQETELLMLFKTTGACCERLQALLLAEHPYEQPEIIQLPVSGGSQGYLSWLLANTQTAEDQQG